MTASSWPMRWQRSSAWSCLAGVQSSSRKATLEARVSVRPCPATSIEQTISWFSGPSGSWKALQGCVAGARGCPRRGCAGRAGKRVEDARWISRWWANTTSRSPEEQKSWIQASAACSLPRAASSLSAFRRTRRSARSAAATFASSSREVQRLAAQPRDEVPLGEPVLGLVVELDRHDRARLRRAAAAARRPSGAARSSARAGASAGAGGRPARGSARRTARPSRSPRDGRGSAAGRSAPRAGSSPACR